MKIKGDFVTNSSSSSFAMWGIYIDRGDLPEEIINEAYQCYIEYCDDHNYSDKDILSIEEFVDDGEITEFIMDLVQKKSGNLHITTGYESSDLYIGRYCSDINETETLKELKDKLKVDLDKLSPSLLEKRVISYHEECYMG